MPGECGRLALRETLSFGFAGSMAGGYLGDMGGEALGRKIGGMYGNEDRGEAIGAARVIVARDDRLHAMRAHGFVDPRIVGRDDDAHGAARLCALGNGS